MSLVFDGEHDPGDWASLDRRREWLKRRIRQTGDKRTPVRLLPTRVCLRCIRTSSRSARRKRTARAIQGVHVANKRADRPP
eukprot:IDg23156t1